MPQIESFRVFYQRVANQNEISGTDVQETLVFYDSLMPCMRRWNACGLSYFLLSYHDNVDNLSWLAAIPYQVDLEDRRLSLTYIVLKYRSATSEGTYHPLRLERYLWWGELTTYRCIGAFIWLAHCLSCFFRPLHNVHE